MRSVIEENWHDQFLASARRGEVAAPPSAWWIVTRQCNLKCPYCFAEAGEKDPDELSTEEALRIITDLADAGVLFITFLGGEPLMRRDIFELLQHAYDLGIYTALLTNGLTVTEKTIERLKQVGVEMFGVSIDHDDPELHDLVRGVKGSQARALRAIQMARDAGMRTSIRVVINDKSEEAVPRLYRWAQEERISELILLPEFGVGRAASREAAERDLTVKAIYARVEQQLREMGAPLPPNAVVCAQGIELTDLDQRNVRAHNHHDGFQVATGCKVGKFMVSIQPNGDVFSCPFVPYKIGSLREQSITEIWQHPLLSANRQRDKGCLTRALIHAGSVYADDPTYVEGAGSVQFLPMAGAGKGGDGQ